MRVSTFSTILFISFLNCIFSIVHCQSLSNIDQNKFFEKEYFTLINKSFQSLRKYLTERYVEIPIKIKLNAEKPAWLGTNVMWQKGKTRSRLYIMKGEYFISQNSVESHYLSFKIGAGKLGLGVETSVLGGIYLKSFTPALELKFGSAFIWPSEFIQINYQIGYRYLSFKKKTIKHIQPNNTFSDRNFTEKYSTDIEIIKTKFNELNLCYTGFLVDLEMRIFL
jgi:hypothetical protein